MRGALASEWIKLSTIRSTWIVLGLTIAAGGLVSWACATFVTDEVLTVSQVYNYSTVLTGMIAAVAGVLLFSSEVQHGTLAPALAAQPDRTAIAFAKAIAAAVFGAALGAAGVAASITGALVGGLAIGDSSSMLTGILLSILFTTIAGVLGLGVGLILRHGAAAIAGLLVWGLVIENLLKVFAPEQVARFLPFAAGNGMLGIETRTGAGSPVAASLTAAQDALIFGGYAAAALAVGVVLLRRRDAN